MQPSPEKLIEQLRSLRLSDAERSVLRASLIAKMQDDFSRPVRSPWTEFFAMRRVQAASLIAIIIISYSSSAALAAEGALPGDILYPVKTRVVEPLARMVAARTPEREAAFETNLLERRLHEAETLDAAATLEAPLREEVREHVRAQNARAEVAARRADEESDEDSTARQPRDASVASSTIATGSPVRLEGDRRSKRDVETHDRDERYEKNEKRSERAARVLKEHTRILEKLEIKVAEDDDEDDDGKNNDGDDNDKEEHEGDD